MDNEIKRQKVVKIFDHEYILTNRHKRFADQLERDFHITHKTIRKINNEHSIGLKIPEHEVLRLLRENDRIDEDIERDADAVNDRTIMEYIRNTPNCPTIEQIKEDETEYMLLLNEVLFFQKGIEMYESKVLFQLEQYLSESKDEAIPPKTILEHISKLKDEQFGDKHKKKQ